MRHSSRLAWMLAVLILLCTKFVAADSLLWETNLDRASQMAAQSNRLLLVHFWAPWCGYCKRMDAEVFAHPEVAKQIQANYVPVKLDADQNPELTKKYGISGLPTDVVLTPQGQVVRVVLGKADAAQYVARLNQLSAGFRQQNAGVLASLPASAPPANVSLPAANPPLANLPSAAPINPPLPNPALSQPMTPAPAYGQSLGMNGPANGAGVPGNALPAETTPPALPQNPGQVNNPPLLNNAQPAANAKIDNAVATLMQNPPATPRIAPPIAPPANAALSPSVNPPLALDGFCPVSLIEKHKWVPGDKRWGAYHLGRTYLFAGPEEQSKFLANSNYDRYAPVASGADVVIAAEEHKLVPGMREHGVFFKDRIFLFANEASLQKFSANPFYYMGQALGTPQQAAAPGRQPRY